MPSLAERRPVFVLLLRPDAIEAEDGTLYTAS